jgi:hypothetical protein
LASKIGQLFVTAPVCDVVTFGGRQNGQEGHGPAPGEGQRCADPAQYRHD